jgi:hypothetical protein
VKNKLLPKAKFIASQKFRTIFHFSFIFLASVFLGLFPLELVSQTEGLAEDKVKHFVGGHMIGTAIFHLGYIILAVKILLFGKGPLTIRLMWLPTIFFFLGGFSLFIVSLVAGGKELIDSTGFGNVEWADFVATVDGAYMPNIQSALILLALTPAMIPMDLMLQWPERWLRGNKTGHKDVDEYLEVQKSVKNSGKAPILIVEDDLSCASTVMKFFQKVHLNCRHEDTLKNAMAAFVECYPVLKVVVLDLFVRVEDAKDRRTGADWLAKISQKFPKGERSFLVVITTGHPEQLGDKADLADLVLGKPWSPVEFKQYLKEQGVIH